MFWFGMLASSARARLGWASAFAALGVALEYAQGLTGYRTFDVVDMAANTAGVALGWLAAVTPAGRLLAWVERRISASPP
jgi:glycopeptide antibiotics resistance protein